MASLASINIRFNADLKGFSSQLQNATKGIEQAGKKMQSVGKSLSLFVTAPIVGLGVKSVAVFDTQAKAIAQVEAGLKSTGNQVGYTSAQLQKMASDFQDVSLFGDEEILQGVTAQLLTFTNITGEQFKKTELAALNLATRLDGDLKSASIQLGKALNDPKANLSALSRSGIQFSESQKKMINSLQESGKLAEAQNIILAELEKQYGGSAKAAAEAGAGPLKQLSNSFGDLLEQFGAIIIEGLKPFILYIKDMVKGFQELSPETKKIIVVVASLVAVIGPLVAIIGTVLTLVPSMVAGFLAVKAAFLSFSSTISAFIAANPFTVMAAALAVLVFGIYQYSKASSDAVLVTNTLNDVRDQAAKSVAKEKAELDTLLKIAKDETLSKKDRENAIKKLNDISPEYLGNLKLETINTDEAKRAIENYNIALNKRALAQAVLSKKTELFNQLIDVQQRSLNDSGIAFENASQKISDYIFGLFGVESQIIRNKEELENWIKTSKLSNEQAKGARDAYEPLLKARERDVNKIQVQIDALDKFNDVTGVATSETDELTTSVTNLANARGKSLIKGSIEFYENEISNLKKLQKETTLTQFAYLGLQKQIDEYQSKIDSISAPITSPLDDIEAPKIDFTEWFDKWSKAKEVVPEARSSMQLEMDKIKEISQDFSNSISSIMESAAENLAVGFGQLIGSIAAGAPAIQSIYSFLMNSIASLMEQLGKSAIQIGITMEAIKASFSSPFAAIASGIALIALSSIIKSAIPSEFAGSFANGGFVGGNSFAGDKLWARVNSGELILNQKQQGSLYGMLNDNASNVNIGLDGAFKISGSDLELVIDRAIQKNNRKK